MTINPAWQLSFIVSPMLYCCLNGEIVTLSDIGGLRHTAAVTNNKKRHNSCWFNAVWVFTESHNALSEEPYIKTLSNTEHLSDIQN